MTQEAQDPWARARRALIDAATEAGFPLVGVVDLAAPGVGEALAENVARYDAWLARGYAGEMSYLHRGRDRRADPLKVFPEARSVLCVAEPHSSRPAGNPDPARGPRYARYLRGEDYHRSIAARLDSALVSAAVAFPGLRWKTCVDTSAVLERAWAALAGLGWIGKNTMLIHPRLGSYLMLGVAYVNVETGAHPAPLPDYCGSCDRCLRGCPTSAFSASRDLDSRRCISYWTLEKRGDLNLGPADARAVGPWVAGCDICQEVCPFNQKVARHDPHPGLEDGATSLSDWDALESETEEQYRARVETSSLSRVKSEQFRRNLEVVRTNFSPECRPR